jgi:hypothetical protein
MSQGTTLGLLFDDTPLVGADVFSFPTGGLSAGVTGQIQNGQGGRYLDIVGTMAIGGLASNLVSTSALREAIVGRLRNSGWSVGNVQLTFTGGLYRIRISVWVYNTYSNQAVLNAAARILTNFNLGLYGWGPAAFRDIRLALETPNATAGAYTNLPPANYGGSGKVDAGSFLDNLGAGIGSGLGVSTPIVIGAGVLLLVLVLRK